MNRIRNYKREKDSLKPVTDPPQRKLKENKITIIEDGVDFANSLKVVMNNYGYDVFIVVDRAEAIKKVKEIQPHIVFVDVCLEQASGFGLPDEFKNFILICYALSLRLTQKRILR